MTGKVTLFVVWWLKDSDRLVKGTAGFPTVASALTNIEKNKIERKAHGFLLAEVRDVEGNIIEQMAL